MKTIPYLLCITIFLACVHEINASPEIYENAKALQQKNNPVFYNPNWQSETILPFLVEINSGSSSKFERRTATGQIILDREICPQTRGGFHKYPAHYGIATGRFSSDGDPLDLLVYGRSSFYKDLVDQRKTEIQPVRLIGLIKMEECDDVPCSENDWTRDWKVIAVDSKDPTLSQIRDIAQLSAKKRNELTTFFSNYKGLRDGHARTRVTGFLDLKQTQTFLKGFLVADVRERTQEIEDCRSHFQFVRKKWQSLPSKPKRDKKFINCLSRVFDAEFFKDQNTFEKFIKFSAYQLLKKPKGSWQKSLGELNKKRFQKKKHYRFVLTDQVNPKDNGIYASEGSGQLIMEWVKTVRRDRGCKIDTPRQHYLSYDVVSGLVPF